MPVSKLFGSGRVEEAIGRTTYRSSSVGRLRDDKWLEADLVASETALVSDPEAAHSSHVAGWDGDCRLADLAGCVLGCPARLVRISLTSCAFQGVEARCARPRNQKNASSSQVFWPAERLERPSRHDSRRPQWNGADERRGRTQCYAPLKPP